MPLAQALEIFAQRTGLQLVYVSQAAEGVVSKEVPAGLTPGETLNQLLEGTGNIFEFLNARTVRIFTVAPATSNKPIPREDPGCANTSSGERPCKRIESDHDATHDNITNVIRGDKVITGKKRGLFARIAGLFAVCGAAMQSSGACAQETSNLPVSESKTLEEVVVTARRVEENLQDVPVTISALTSEALESNPIRNQWDLTSYVPGLTVSMTSGTSGSGNVSSANYALRGLRSVGVVTYFADVPTLPTTSRALYDLSSVQVLEGPQGTLFGKNTTAGAILFGPSPPTDKLEGYVQLSGGTYELRAAQGMVNIPVIADALMVRFAGETYRRDGWQKVRPYDDTDSSSALGSDRHDSGRASALFKPIDKLEILTIYSWFSADEVPQTGQQVINRDCPETPTAAQRNVYAPCIYQPPLTTDNNLPPSWNDTAMEGLSLGARTTTNPATGTRNYSNDWQLINRATYDLTDALTVKNIFGLVNTHTDNDLDNDSTVFPHQWVVTRNSSERLSNEFQMNGIYENLQFTVGTFYSDILNSDGFTQATTGDLGPNPNRPSIGITEMTNRSKAVFGQASYAISPRLSLTVGARYTWIDKSSVAQSYTGPFLPDTDHGRCSYTASTPFVDLATCTRTLGPASFDAPSWNTSISYKMTDKVLTYLTISEGFDEGGFNGASSDFLTYDPETLLNFETGVKADWTLFGRPIRTNVGAYLSKFKDIQRSVQRVNDQGVGVGGTINAASATIWGAQFKLDMWLTENLQLTANANTLNAGYDEFDYAPAVGGGFISVASNELALAPKFTGSVGAIYHVPVNPSIARDLAASINYAYQSVKYTTDINPLNPTLSNADDPYSTVPGYALVNLQINWRGIFGSPSIDGSFFVSNLTDETYRTGIVNNANSYGYVVAYYGLPRMVGASLKYSF